MVADQLTRDRLSRFSALGDATRLAIVELLAAGPQPVGKLADELPVTRPAVSQHLKVLKDAGLVVADREGTRHLYRLDLEGIGAARAYLDRFWNQALAAFKVVAERDPNRRGANGPGNEQEVQ